MIEGAYRIGVYKRVYTDALCGVQDVREYLLAHIVHDGLVGLEGYILSGVHIYLGYAVLTAEQCQRVAYAEVVVEVFHYGVLGLIIGFASPHHHAGALCVIEVGIQLYIPAPEQLLKALSDVGVVFVYEEQILYVVHL